MNRQNRHRDYPNLLTTILGMPLSEIEWTAQKVSKRTQKRMRAQAAAIGRKIAAEDRAAALAWLAEVGRQIASDALDQQRRDAAEAERQANERDLAETLKTIDRMVEQELPALRAELEQKRKKRKAMGKAVKRERAKLEAAAKKLAKLKLAQLRRR
jgi:hypothetical protein